MSTTEFSRWLQRRVSVLVALSTLALACGPGDIESRLAEPRALQAAGQFSESVEPLREILATSPDHPEANYLLGVALVSTGQPSLAVWSLEKAAGTPEYALQAGLLLASTFLSIEAYEDTLTRSSAPAGMRMRSKTPIV